MARFATHVPFFFFFFFGVARRLGHLPDTNSVLYDTRRKFPYAPVCSTVCGARTGRPPRIICSGLASHVRS